MQEGQAGLTSAERRLEEPGPALWFLRIALRSLWTQIGVSCRAQVWEDLPVCPSWMSGMNSYGA